MVAVALFINSKYGFRSEPSLLTDGVLRFPAMTRSELMARLHNQYSQLTRQDIDDAVRTILDAIANQIAENGRVEIRGFGSFSVHTLPPRMGRNPKTGDQVSVPVRRVPHFKSGVELRKRINR